MSHSSSSKLATAVGSTSVLLWGTLALLTQLTGGRVPPFQLLAMTFSLAFATMLIKWLVCGQNPLRYLRQPPVVWLIGIGALFGYHLFYFIALAKAPAVEASLIAYLWPLLIVLMSARLPGETLYIAHLVGAMIAFAGCWLLIGGQQFDVAYLPGYLAAATCALIWSSYSVASRTLKAVPTDTVGWFCGATAVLAWLCHLSFESSVWPQATVEWIGVIGLGIGPVGVAFFTWDYGVKRGNLQLLGVLSYAAPLVSTLLLILAGEASATLSVLIACLAIVGGAIIAGMAGRKSAT